jgi:hypothetical protein
VCTTCSAVVSFLLLNLYGQGCHPGRQERRATTGPKTQLKTSLQLTSV